MIYWDGTRLGADSLHDLARYCQKKGLNPRDMQCDTVTFVYLPNKGAKRLIESSNSVRMVTADEFNRMSIRASNDEIKAFLIGWESISEARRVPGEDMNPIETKSKWGKGYKKVGSFTATGEFELFKEIAQERRGEDGILRSEISGTPLIDNPRHPFYVNQFMHCVPKGQYEHYRLLKENIFLGTVSEHRLQTNDPGATKKDSRWDGFWAKYEELRARYHWVYHNKK